MLSLTQRLLIAASVVLLAFLGLTGVALDHAFRESALVAMQDRLRAQIYMLLGVADLDTEQRLTLPDALPEARFSTPGSGLYAGVVREDGGVVWRSPSMLGIDIPFTASPNPGVAFFSPINQRNVNPLFALNYTVNWELSSGEYQRYTFWVAESQQSYKDQIAGFQRSLWAWLLAPVIVLVAVQGLILRWGLKPLRQVAAEVGEIEAGERRELAGRYPKELQPLTENLNHLIQHSHSHLERYRNALGDLAHSLKTPLAVLRGALENNLPQPALRHALEEQLTRMNQTVEYQLSRAAASGRIALSTPIPVEPVARKIMDSLAKVYVDKKLNLNLDVEPQLDFQGDEGDLMELLGNLADNACKWTRTRVDIRLHREAAVSEKTNGLVLEVDDDGPGISSDQLQTLLGRGQRADADTPGHGIGLAVVRELVEEIYQGSLEIGASALGGACVRVRL